MRIWMFEDNAGHLMISNGREWWDVTGEDGTALLDMLAAFDGDTKEWIGPHGEHEGIRPLVFPGGRPDVGEHYDLVAQITGPDREIRIYPAAMGSAALEAFRIPAD